MYIFFLHLLLTCKILQAKSSHFNTNLTNLSSWPLKKNKTSNS